MSTFLIILLSAVGLLIAACLALALVAAFRGILRIDYDGLFRDNSLTTSARGKFAERIYADVSEIESLPMETIYIESFDELKLASRLLLAETSAIGTVICFHGLRSKSEKDYGAQAVFFHKLGYNVLLPDQRSHNRSEGRWICYGVRERYDCLQWTKLMSERFGAELPIFLSGQSMGAATVMMASNLELPRNVLGIVSDCGFCSVAAEFQYVLNTEFHIPTFPTLFLMGMWCRLIAGIGLWKVSPTKSLSESKVPVLFFHGKKDTLVPYYMGEENFKACTAPKFFVSSEIADHCTCWYEDTNGYKHSLLDFFEFCRKSRPV